MTHRSATLAVLLLAVISLAATCPSPSAEISRDRAIEIARAHATFTIVTVEASRTKEDGRPVWRVTLQGEPMSPGSPLRPTLIVYVDRQSGEVISIARS